MKSTRREFMINSTASAGAITLLPFAATAAAHGNHVFKAPGGEVKIHPIDHASFVMETPELNIYVDPIGGAEKYKDFQKPDLILITHHHGDHFDPATLEGVIGTNTRMLVNPTVFDKLTGVLKAASSSVANNELVLIDDLSVQSIPAYNTTAGREKFHPQGRDNGYVVSMDGFRVYISGDTEDIPEMRALEDIDLAFVCMNLPFTMDAKAAASAVAEFKPKYVYPYHYRGKDGGTQDPKEFAKLVGDASEVRLGNWY